MDNKMMGISEMHAYIILLPASGPAHVHVRWRVHSDYTTLSYTVASVIRQKQTESASDYCLTRFLCGMSEVSLRGQTEALGGKTRLLHCDTSRASSIQAGAVLYVSLCTAYLNIRVCASLYLLHAKYQTTHSTSQMGTFFAKWGHFSSSHNTEKDCLRVKTWFKGFRWGLRLVGQEVSWDGWVYGWNALCLCLCWQG